jgi:zona occludens toxin (predicted ATPase)
LTSHNAVRYQNILVKLAPQIIDVESRNNGLQGLGLELVLKQPQHTSHKIEILNRGKRDQYQQIHQTTHNREISTNKGSRPNQNYQKTTSFSFFFFIFTSVFLFLFHLNFLFVLWLSLIANMIEMQVILAYIIIFLFNFANKTLRYK